MSRCIVNSMNLEKSNDLNFEIWREYYTSCGIIIGMLIHTSILKNRMCTCCVHGQRYMCAVVGVMNIACCFFKVCGQCGSRSGS